MTKIPDIILKAGIIYFSSWILRYKSIMVRRCGARKQFILP
jgi:hypothetical protein